MNKEKFFSFAEHTEVIVPSVNIKDLKNSSFETSIKIDYLS